MPILHKCYNQNPNIKKLRQLWRWDCYEIVKIFCVRAARAELARKWVEVMQFIELLPPYFMTWRHHLSVWTDILAYFLYRGGKIQNKICQHSCLLVYCQPTYTDVHTYMYINGGPVIGYYNSSTICSWQYQWKNSNWCVPWQQWFIWHKNLYQLWKPQQEFIWVMKLTSLLELSLQSKGHTFGASRLECNWNPWTNILQV